MPVSFFFHISCFIWFVCLRGTLVGDPRKFQGRRRSTCSGILSGLWHTVPPLAPPPSDRVPPSITPHKIVCCFPLCFSSSSSLHRLSLFAFPAVLTKQLSIAAVSMKIATSVDKFVSKQQKALFLRQQLAAINAELQRFELAGTDLHGGGNIAEDEDDLDILVRRVDVLPAGTEVRRVSSTGARHLRRVPPQNVEHGVVRNVRTSVFFPYPRIMSDTTLS